MICPKCGGRLVLNRDYYLVCEKCGAVVANTFFNERDLDEMYVTRKNPKQPHYLGTIIDNYALDRFYKYHSYLHLSHHNSTYYRVIQTLYRVCGRLNINKIVQARAITLYFKSIRNLNSKRPNHFRIMAAFPELTRIINIKKLQGKNPLVSALSLLYIADQILCKKIGLRNQILTQRFLSEISGMALSTIVIRLRIIKGQLMGNLNEEYIYGNC